MWALEINCCIHLCVGACTLHIAYIVQIYIVWFVCFVHKTIFCSLFVHVGRKSALNVTWWRTTATINFILFVSYFSRSSNSTNCSAYITWLMLLPCEYLHNCMVLFFLPTSRTVQTFNEVYRWIQCNVVCCCFSFFLLMRTFKIECIMFIARHTRTQNKFNYTLCRHTQT